MDDIGMDKPRIRQIRTSPFRTGRRKAKSCLIIVNPIVGEYVICQACCRKTPGIEKAVFSSCQTLISV